MKKKRIHSSSNIISSASLNNNYFQIFTSILINCSFKINGFTLHRKSFLKDLLRHGKDEYKRESMTIANQISYHGYISMS